MRITICGSLQFIKEMNNVAADLMKEGHIPILPDSAVTGKDKQYWKSLHNKDSRHFPKIRGDRIKLHCSKIDEAEAILVLNDIPFTNIQEEVEAMQPTIIQNNLKNIGI